MILIHMSMDGGWRKKKNANYQTDDQTDVKNKRIDRFLSTPNYTRERGERIASPLPRNQQSEA